jgi:hypothetical protein
MAETECFHLDEVEVYGSDVAEPGTVEFSRQPWLIPIIGESPAKGA